MALQLLKLKRVSQPLLNEIGSGIIFDDRHRFITEHIIDMIKKTPELIGMLDTVVTDHFQGPVDFFDADGKALGSTNLKRVKMLWEDKNVMNAFYGQGMDYFIDGSSFGWTVNVDNVLTQKQKEVLVRLKAISTNLFDSMQESISLPRVISYLAASTVEIVNDKVGIIKYIQNVGDSRVEWDPEQVVHIKLMEFNGEVRGFSGLKSLTKEIVLMYLLKENILAKMQNGGSPDYIISLVNSNGVSKARFERLRTALESFSHLKKSHGNMPIDADVKVFPLGMDLKEMEYRELAMFIISEFALSLGVPTSRIPFMMTGAGGTSNKGELSGNSEDSYQKKINNRRCAWEREWNKVFRRAGFSFMFRRDNLQDDVRETQAATQRSAFVQGAMNNLRSIGKQLTVDAVLALLSGTKKNLDIDDLEDLDVELNTELTMGVGQGMGASNPGMKSRVSRDRSASKMRTASNNGVSS